MEGPGSRRDLPFSDDPFPGCPGRSVKTGEWPDVLVAPISERIERRPDRLSLALRSLVLAQHHAPFLEEALNTRIVSLQPRDCGERRRRTPVTPYSHMAKTGLTLVLDVSTGLAKALHR